MTDEELAMILLGQQQFALAKLRAENAALRAKIAALAPTPADTPKEPTAG